VERFELLAEFLEFVSCATPASLVKKSYGPALIKLGRRTLKKREHLCRSLVSALSFEHSAVVYRLIQR
jgi:hypothetical protein